MGNEHAGHRQRMKNRFLEQGLDGFEPHQALELLLFFAIPQGDVNPLAHRLIQHFGSLQAVLEATSQELMRVEGVGAHTATLLSLMIPMTRLSRENQLKQNLKIVSSSDAIALVQTMIGKSRNEQILLLFLDGMGRLMHSEIVAQGSNVQVQAPMANIIELAVRIHPHSIILAHNHPGGKVQPSLEDTMFTKRLAMALSFQDVCLLDHLVVNGEEYYSFYQQGDMQHIREVQRAAAQQEMEEYR